MADSIIASSVQDAYQKLFTSWRVTHEVNESDVSLFEEKFGSITSSSSTFQPFWIALLQQTAADPSNVATIWTNAWAGVGVTLDSFTLQPDASGNVTIMCYGNGVPWNYVIDGSDSSFFSTLEPVPVVYAIEVTITFDAAGGNPTPPNQTVSGEPGSAPINPQPVTNPTKSTYTFAGWYKGDTLVSTDGQIWQNLGYIDADETTITLTAHWSREEAKGGYVIL